MTAYNKVNGEYASRNSTSDQRCPQKSLGLSRLGDVRLGRNTELGVRAQRSRPGVRRADRRPTLAGRGVHRPAACRLRRGQAAQVSGSRKWSAGYCGRCSPSESTAETRRPYRTWPRTTALRGHRPPGNCAAAKSRAAATDAGIDAPGRRHRRLRTSRCADRLRVECRRSARRLRGRHPDRCAGLPGIGRNLYLLPSSPLEELRKRLPHSWIDFDPGISPAEAALTARQADVVIVFGVRVEGEGLDSADLTLPWGQDEVISAVAEANSNTVVVLETGNPVDMPWRDSVHAILQAWYPGQAGGQAIAEIIVGADQSVRPAAGDLSGWAGPDAAARASRARRIAGEPRRPSTTRRALMSDTGGSRRRRPSRCSLSGMACPTPPSSTAT